MAPLHQPLLPVSAFVQDDSPPRKHLCCFCCCNMRQTVIWIQIFFGIIWSIAWLISYRMGYYKQWTSDPQIIADLSNAYGKVSIINGVHIGVALVVIIGAIMYKPALVFVGAIFTIIESILTPIYIYPVAKDFYPSAWAYIAWPIIYGLLILYPHVVLTYELKIGVWEKPNFSE
eukprot:scaffold12348_cov145-Skeletonema_menzelii.AAC.6